MKKLYPFTLLLLTTCSSFCAQSASTLAPQVNNKKANLRSVLQFWSQRTHPTDLVSNVVKPKPHRAQLTLAHHAAHQKHVESKTVIKRQLPLGCFTSLNTDTFCTLEKCAQNAILNNNLRGMHNLLVYKRSTISNPFGKSLFQIDSYTAYILSEENPVIIPDSLLGEIFENNIINIDDFYNKLTLASLLINRSAVLLKRIVTLQPNLLTIKFLDVIDSFGLDKKPLSLIEAIEKLKVLKAAGLNLDTFDEFDTPLTKTSNSETILPYALIEVGCDVNVPSSENYHPLFAATIANNNQLIEALINHGAKLDTKNGLEQVTALHVANNEGARILLNAGANPRILNSKGESYLGNLLKKPDQNRDLITLALQTIIRLKRFTSESSCAMGHIELIDIIKLDSSVISDDMLEKVFQAGITTIDDSNNEKILAAIFTNRPAACLKRIVTLLPDLLNVRFIQHIDKQSMPFVEIVEKLKIVKDAGMNLDADFEGHTPLTFSCVQKSRMLLAYALIQAGCNINLACRKGYYPLYGASFADNSELIETLISHNAQLDTKNCIALSTALYVADAKGARILLTAGANPRIVNREGESYLGNLLKKPDQNRDLITLALQTIVRLERSNSESCCAICHEELSEFTNSQLHVARCCFNILCKDCSPGTECPFCRKPNLAFLDVPDESTGATSTTTTTTISS